MINRLAVVVVTVSTAVAVLALTGVVLGSMPGDADAANRTQLKVLWADIGSDGFLNAGRGAEDVTKTGTGSYEVRFVQNVNGCAHTATLQQSAGEISVGTGAYFTPSAGNQFAGSREVVIFTRDSAGAYADRATNLVLNC